MWDIIACGDGSQYQFLREILEEGTRAVDLSTLDTEILPGYEVNVGRVGQENLWEESSKMCFSPLVPFYTHIIFPKVGTERRAYSSRARLLLFDDFPYRTKSGLLSIQHLQQDTMIQDMVIILFENIDRGLSTDRTSIADAANVAEDEYRKEGYKVIRYSPGNFREIFFQQIRGVKWQLRRIVRLKLDKAREELQSFYVVCEELIQQENELQLDRPLSGLRMNAITKYRQSWAGKQLWESYIQAAKKYCFSDTGAGRSLFINIGNNLYDIVFFRLEMILGNREQIGQGFMQVAQEKMCKKLKKNQKSCIFYGGQQNEEYEHFMKNNGRLDVEFKDCLQDYLNNDLSHIVIDYAEDLCQQIEEVFGNE